MKKIILETNKLSKTFKDQKAVNELTLTVNEGDIYALLGKNGAGKTTFMKIVLEHIQATGGNFKFHIEKHDIGTIVESPTFYDDLNGFDNLKMHCILTGVPFSKINEVLNVVGLVKDKKAVKKYSLGMKQRLAIARALLTNPKLLILDEPINGLDPTGIYEIRSILSKINIEQQVTIIISSHILAEVETLATRYGIIDKGSTIAEFDVSELHNYTHAVVEECNDYATYQKIANKYMNAEGYTASTLLDKKAYFYGNKQFNEQFKDQLVDTSLEKYFIAVTGGARVV